GQVFRGRVQLVRYLEQLFFEFDLLATPTVSPVGFAAAGPLPFVIVGEPVAAPGGGMGFPFSVTFSVNPAISVPAVLSVEHLPVGLQLVAPRFREDLLLQVAYQYEQTRPWHHEWPRL